MSLTLKQLRYFIAAAETGQISHAAMEMNISQSAVTAGIQGLEAQLGVSLLRRGAQGVTVTPEGARFLARARGIMAAVEDATRSPLGRKAALRGGCGSGSPIRWQATSWPAIMPRSGATFPASRWS